MSDRLRLVVGWPIGVGVTLLVALLAVSVLARKGFLAKPLQRRKTEDARIWPVKWVFWATIIVALASLTVTTQSPEFTLPPAFSYLFLLVGAVALGGFSIACATVFGARDLNADDTNGR